MADDCMLWYYPASRRGIQTGQTIIYLWSDNKSAVYQDRNRSVRDIHFIQDESGTDKLTFTINRDHDAYEEIHAGADNIIRMSYPTGAYFYFMIIRVQTDKVRKEKKVICASSLIYLDWIPVMEMNINTDNTLPLYWYFNENGLTAMRNAFSMSWDWLSNCYFSRPSIVETHDDDNFDGNYGTSKDIYGKRYSDLKRDLIDRTGIRIVRKSTTNFCDYYMATTIDWLKKNATLHEITNPSAVLKYETTEDLTDYYTHATIYTEPQYEVKQDASGKYHENAAYKVHTSTVQVRNNEECVRYGEKFFTSVAENKTGSFKTEMKSAKITVKGTAVDYSELKLNPGVIGAGYDFAIYHRLHILLEEADIDQKLLIIYYDRCLDNPLNSVIDTIDIEKDGQHDYARYDSARYGMNVYA